MNSTKTNLIIAKLNLELLIRKLEKGIIVKEQELLRSLKDTLDCIENVNPTNCK